MSLAETLGFAISIPVSIASVVMSARLRQDRGKR